MKFLYNPELHPSQYPPKLHNFDVEKLLSPSRRVGFNHVATQGLLFHASPTTATALLHFRWFGGEREIENSAPT